MSLPAVGLIAASTVIGAIPTGYWLGRALRGVDIRQHGSGNLGATNVFRVLGAGPGAITLAVDILKGAVAVGMSRTLAPGSDGLALAAGTAAILGHTFSPFVGFKGGKGVATAAGVFVTLMPGPGWIAVGTFALSFLWSRIVSISSVLAAAALAISAWILIPVPAYAAMASGMALLIIWKHRSNLVRLHRGEEPRIDFSRRTPS